MQPLTERLFGVFKPVVEGLGLHLVDVEWIPARGGRRLAVHIARKEDSVSLDDCSMVTRALETAIEEEPELEDSYTLEVSSPGLDRVLKRPEEFDIFTGRTIALVLHEPVNGLLDIEGGLQGLDGENVTLMIVGETLSIPITNIKKAKLVFKFKLR